MILKNAKIVNEHFQYEYADIQIKDGRISRIEPGLKGEDTVDYSGKTIIPGLFDIHTHDCIGHQVVNCTLESLQEMADFYAENGVTSYLATLDSQTIETLENACRTITQYRNAAQKGAVIRGIHLEGLFFSERCKGGHPTKFLIPPDVEVVRRLNRICGGGLLLACVAPELPGADDFIEELSKDMVISIAHTDATYETVRHAVRLGARSFTHLFNGMRPWDHREPGVVGAAFDSPDMYKEIIADGMHLAPATVRNAFRLIGPDHVILISDSSVATGLSDGIYEIGRENERRIVVKNGLVYLENTSTIAGSSFHLFRMLRNAVQSIGIDFLTAVRACTINPAKLVGLDRETGSIGLGKSADLVVINNDMDICDVYIKGKKYKKGGCNVFSV